MSKLWDEYLRRVTRQFVDRVHEIAPGANPDEVMEILGEELDRHNAQWGDNPAFAFDVEMAVRAELRRKRIAKGTP